MHQVKVHKIKMVRQGYGLLKKVQSIQVMSKVNTKQMNESIRFALYMLMVVITPK